MGATVEVRRLRVVLDTNVLVSALLFGRGRLIWIRHAWQAGELVPLMSRETAAELLTVLRYPKFQLSSLEREDLLADLLPFCETISVDVALSDMPSCRDDHDRKFLAVAVAGGADRLVTGDVDLLALAGSFPIPIVTPAALLADVRGASP